MILEVEGFLENTDQVPYFTDVVGGKDQVREDGQPLQAAGGTHMIGTMLPNLGACNFWNTNNWPRRYEGYFQIFRKPDGNHIFAIHRAAKVAKN